MHSLSNLTPPSLRSFRHLAVWSGGTHFCRPLTEVGRPIGSSSDEPAGEWRCTRAKVWTPWQLAIVWAWPSPRPEKSSSTRSSVFHRPRDCRGSAPRRRSRTAAATLSSDTPYLSTKHLESAVLQRPLDRWRPTALILADASRSYRNPLAGESQRSALESAVMVAYAEPCSTAAIASAR